MGCVGSLLLPASRASATLPATGPDDTGMVNGKVRAIVQAGGRTWVAGTFTQMLNANGTAVRAVDNLAAFNASTGAPDLGVSIPSVTKSSGTPIVYDMSVGPDGKVYIAGAFDRVNGQGRKNVAAFDPITGSLGPFSANPANATAVLATSDAVFVGTSKLVKFTLSGAGAPGYDPPQVAVDPSLRGHSIPAQFRDIVQVGSTLVAACQCDSLDDGRGFTNVKSVVKIDASTGDRLSWAPGGLDSNSASFGISAFVRDFPSASDRTVFLAAGGSDFTAAYDYESGQQRWKTDTSGSSQVVTWHQNTLIVGGHFQWVPRSGGQQCGDNANPNTSCWHAPRLVAMDPSDGDVLLQGGVPWNPGICCRYNGVWALLVDGDGGKLHVGGEFTKVGGAWAGSGTSWTLNGAQRQEFYARLFAPATGSQTLSVSTSGDGAVTSVPSGISCGAVCSASYTSGAAVTLTASPGAGSAFAGWSGGGCSGMALQCQLTMDQHRSVTAAFAPIVELTVSAIGSGSGSVTSSPAGIGCPPTCTASFPSGSTVVLAADPDPDTAFTGWSGGGCSGTGTCQVTMSQAQAVTATFQPGFQLTVAKDGLGNGKVTSDVGGISCGGTCEVTIAEGTLVTLTAVPAGGSAFAGWSGSGCDGADTCRVTMSQAQTVTATFDATSACGRILFTSNRSGNPDVWVMDPDGTDETNLTNRSGSDTDPVWSPDCSSIAFTSTRSGNVDVYVMNADGSGAGRLTTHTASDSEPAWSPDGSQIAFVSTRTGNAEIFVMGADGSNQVNVTGHPATDTSPDWSPDGASIAFDSTRGGGLNVWAIDPTGGSLAQLTSGLGSAHAPAWSPDGQLLAFVSDSSGKSQIWIMNADRTGASRLISDAGAHSHPSWSPEGTQLAYASNLSGKNQIWVVDQAGAGAANVSTSENADTLPNWSA